MTTNRKVGSTTHCFACGQVKDKRLLVMHIPHMRTYCRELDVCGEPKKNVLYLRDIYTTSEEYQSFCIVKNDYDSIEEGVRRYYTHNAAETIMNLLGKALRVRLNTNQTLYMAKFAQENGTETTTETISKMIEKLMSLDPSIENKKLVKTNLVD